MISTGDGLTMLGIAAVLVAGIMKVVPKNSNGKYISKALCERTHENVNGWLKSLDEKMNKVLEILAGK